MARPPAPGTRERLLAAAARLFYLHGVRPVGVSRVVAEAGTGKNLLYRHFPAKSDLVTAYLTDADRQRDQRTRAARATAAPDPRAQLLALVEDVAATAALPRFRGCAFRNYLAEFPPGGTDEDPGPADVARRHLHRTRAELARLVAALPVADPTPLTERLWLIVDGLYMQAAYRHHVTDPPDPRTAVALAGELIDRAG